MAPLNRLARDIGAAGQSSHYGYDPQGNRTSTTDPLARVTTHAYDALNRLVRVTEPAGGDTDYAYDPLEQLRQVTDPRGLATSYTRSGLCDLVQQPSPDTGTTRSSYDSAGNLLTQTDAKGQVTAYAYDALNRVVSVRYADGSGVNYLYDQGPHAVGRLTAIVETGSAQQLLRRTDYTYGAHGRVLSETRTLGGIAHVTQYGYDGAGRLVSLAYPSGREVHYGLDALGRIAAVSTTWEGVTQVLAYDIRYRPFGGLESLRFGNGES